MNLGSWAGKRPPDRPEGTYRMLPPPFLPVKLATTVPHAERRPRSTAGRLVLGRSVAEVRWVVATSARYLGLMRSHLARRQAIATLLYLIAMIGSAAPGTAQCNPSYAGGLVRAGVDDEVLALTQWDPDGNGPQPLLLVVGGRFTTAGGVVARGVATYDTATATWGNLGDGFTATMGRAYVTSLRVGANGELFAAGCFTHAAGLATTNIARWDGTAWQPLGSGCYGGVRPSVEGLTLMPNGDLVAGGLFTHAGGIAVNHIARWNGSQWSSFGAGFTGNLVLAVLTRGDGTLVATGNFNGSGGAPLARIAAWTGSTWSPIGAGLPAGGYALAERNGQLLASSWPAVVSAWNGTAWTPFGTNAPTIGDTVRRLCVLPNGDVLACRTEQGIFRCTGPASPWTQVSDALTPGAVEVLAANDYVVGGRFVPTSPHHADGIGRWNGTTWQELTPFLDGDVLTTAPHGAGYVLGGRFLHVGGIATNRIARWDGSQFVALGGGVNGEVRKVVTLGNGHVAALGSFTQAGGVAAAGFAFWNGTSWVAGPNPGQQVKAMTGMPNGDLLVVLATGVLRRWNGALWANHAAPLDPDDYITCMTHRANGELVLAGGFSTVSQPRGLMRWSGTAWEAVGPSLDAMPWSVAEAANGDLYVGGEFTTVGSALAFRIARWNGTAWSRLDPGFDDTVRAVAVLPDGDVLAAGSFRRCGLTPAAGLARWNGRTWLPVTPGFGGGIGGAGSVMGHTQLPTGELLLHGGFGTAGDTGATGVVRLAPGCSPTVATVPTACRGTVAALTLTAAQPAQIGQNLVSQATGCDNNTVAFACYSMRADYLAWFSLPYALPGCDRLVALDVITVVQPVAGIATASLPIPATPSAVDFALYHQMATVQWTSNGALVATVVSNALVLPIQP